MKFAGAFAICMGALALAGCAETKPDEEKDGVETLLLMPVVDLSATELSALLDSDNIRLIDVRTDEEVAEGMIAGAEHIMLDSFDPATLDLSDGREVVLYCRSGRRSGVAAERLSAHTGKPAKHLEGGILAWQEAELPISQP